MEEDNQDLSDFEEEDYETLYKNSQAAISRSQSNQYESKAMQDELLKYVENLDQMKGSDGTSLINVPSNFNSIVESMNRADLATTRSEEKPWSQYLLLDSLNSEFDTEYNGRYTQAFNDAPDVKIARGLAQIQLLDRQLAEAAKKATTVSTVDRIDHDEDGMDTEDPTFVTAGKRQTAAEPSSSNMKEKQRTRAIRKARSQPKDTTEEVQQRRRLELLTSDLEKDVDLQEKLGAYLDPELEQQDREVDARLEQFGRLGLLLQQQVDDGDDGRLEQEGAEEKGKMTEAGGLHHKDKVARHPADYLAQQRRERAERERAQRIDRLLEAVTSQPIRYEALLLEGVAAVPGVADSTEGTGTGRDTSGSKKWRSGGGGGDSSSMGVMEPLSSRISAPSSNPFSAYIYDPLEVPSPSAVNPERPVTASDIQELLRALTATQSHSPSQSDPQSLFSFRSTGLGAGDANADADAEVNSPPPSGEEGFREAVPEDDREVNGDAGAGEETHTHDTVSIAQTQSHKQSHAQHTLQLRPVDREAVRGLVQQYKRDVEALGRVRRCFLMRSQLLGQQQQLAEAGSEAVTGELSEQQQQQQEQEQQGLSGGDASTSRYGCNRNNRGRGTGVSPPLIPEGRTAAADTDMASASGSASVKNSHHREPNKRRSDGGSTSRSSSGKLLDLSEVAPQSMINMAHPALRGSAVAAAASSGEAGLGFSLSHKHDPKQQMEVQCKLPAPPLHHSPVHPTLLPRKGSSSSGGGGECTTSRDSLSPTACVGGSGGGAGIITSPPVYQQSTHTGNSNGYGNSRVVKSLRLTGPPPSASSRTEPHQHATCGVIGGLGRAHLGSSNEHSKALNPNSVPHSVFRAFQQQEQQGHSSNGLSGRSSPDRSLLLVHRSMPGGALVGSGTQQQQQKRRALKAGNVLSSMSGTSSTHKSQTESNKSDANMFI